MIKAFFASWSLLSLLAVAAVPVATLPVQAQTAAPEPAKPAADSVSSDELQKFASVMKKLLVIRRDTDTQMMQAVQQSGLSEARFNEIYMVQKDPNTKPATPITPKEQQSYNEAFAKLSAIDKAAWTKVEDTIKAEGMEFQRFGQISEAVQGNPQLRQSVQKMIQTP